MVELQSKLERRLRRKITLTVTDNRRVMFSFRRRGGVLRVRVHHMFLTAPAFVLDALCRFMRSKSEHAREVIAEFVDSNHHKIRSKRQKRDPDPGGLARGRVYNLHRIFRDLNRRYFGGRVRAHIQWGRRVRRRRKASIKLGSYSEADRRILISPTLDCRNIPKYMVEWVVYHEMLHDLLGFKVVNGVSYAHTPEFRRRERRFTHYARACAWERRNVDKLLAA